MYVLLIVLILYVIKPTFIFKPNGKLREFGFGVDSEGYKKTVLNVHIILFGLISVLFVYTRKGDMKMRIV